MSFFFFSPLPLQILASILFLRTERKVNAILCWFFFSHKKDASLCLECTHDKLIILYVVLVSCRDCFSLTLSHWQNDSLPQQIFFFFFFFQIYMNKYIYSKLASRASYLYFLSLKYTVRCWQVPSTSSGFLAQLRLAFVNFKNKYRETYVFEI